jgi:hypothetical protein
VHELLQHQPAPLYSMHWGKAFPRWTPTVQLGLVKASSWCASWREGEWRRTAYVAAGDAEIRDGVFVGGFTYSSFEYISVGLKSQLGVQS